MGRRQTSVEAVAVSARAADSLVALCFKQVDLLDKRFRAIFVLGTERAQRRELRNRWLGRWSGDSIFQVALGILSQLY